MSKIYATNTFKWSCCISLLLIVSVTYAQRLWTTYWILYGFVEAGLIIIFVCLLVYNVVFWIKGRSEFSQAYIPLLLTGIVAGMVIILPLNYFRNRIDFFVNRQAYNQAAALAVSGRLRKIDYLYELPGKYSNLSTLDGKVELLDKPRHKAVKFFTFNGVPDGQMGFVYVHQGKSTGAIKGLFSEIDKIVNLGDGWFFVAGE